MLFLLPPFLICLIHVCIVYHFYKVANHWLDRVSAFKDANKMTLQNLATVFGPTLLRPAAKEEEKTSGELLVAGAREALTQVAILQHLLSLRAKSAL